MDTQKFTEKSLSAIENAQLEALRRRNSELSSLHLFHALVLQEKGLVPRILEKMGYDFSKINNYWKNHIILLLNKQSRSCDLTNLNSLCINDFVNYLNIILESVSTFLII